MSVWDAHDSCYLHASLWESVLVIITVISTHIKAFVWDSLFHNSFSISVFNQSLTKVFVLEDQQLTEKMCYCDMQRSAERNRSLPDGVIDYTKSLLQSGGEASGEWWIGGREGRLGECSRCSSSPGALWFVCVFLSKARMPVLSNLSYTLERWLASINWTLHAELFSPEGGLWVGVGLFELVLLHSKATLVVFQVNFLVCLVHFERFTCSKLHVN